MRERDRETETDRQSRYRPWIFILFSVAVLTHSFAGFLTTAPRLVRDSVLELTPKWGPQPSAVFTLSYLVFNCLSLLRHSGCQLIFKPKSPPYFRLVSEGGSYLFPMVLHLRWRFGTPCFCRYFLITVVIHLWLADRQRVLWPDSLTW